MKENILKEKSMSLAVRMVNLYKYLTEENRYFLNKSCAVAPPLGLWYMNQNILKARQILFINSLLLKKK